MAEARGVAGSVANRVDGTVEAFLEGDPDAVGVLVEFCRRGPEGAAVERAEVVEEEPRGDTGFRIR
jgi:acylphosphatase